MNTYRLQWLVSVLRACSILATTGVVATAQPIFQGVYGGTGDDEARGGITLALNGDYVVVGESNSFGTDQDIYVASMLRCGALNWSNTYTIGGNDLGRKIRTTPEGGYIIVGDTENSTSPCRFRNDIFLMKLSPTGVVQWVQTYGGINRDEGYDVQVLADGYLVAGRTDNAPANGWDAILIRTDIFGNMMWARTYGGEKDDRFYSCAIDGNEAVAVGSTRSYTPPTDNEEIFLARVNLANGNLITGFPVVYGRTGDDIGRSIVICPNLDLAIAGHTTSMGGVVEGYLLRTTAGGLPVTDRYFGGSDRLGIDEFYEIQAIHPNSFGNEFIVVGAVQDVPNGFGNYDMYVLYTDNNFAPLWQTVHGGSYEDRGYGITNDYLFALPAPQWTAVGFTRSFGAGGSDVYMVRQWFDGESGCNDATPGMIDARAGLAPRPAPTQPQTRDLGCPNLGIPTRNSSYTMLCQLCDLMRRSDTPALTGIIQSEPKDPATIMRLSGLHHR